ncbi:MAG: uroporphyrinogen decarboxylase [Chloroflexi bacterium]|nr:uroporphyrinogen decarboxylase [Chloroflexota bacterium]
MTLSKRERIERLMAGETADRPGIALWRHWPGDDQNPEELARSTLDWQAQHDFDFVKVSPDSGFCVEAWGAESKWVGGDEGNRRYVAHPMRRAEDWAAIQPQDPHQGRLGGQVRCLELIGRGLNDDTPFIQTIFSPTAQIKYLAGSRDVLAHVRMHPDAVEDALAAITETTIRFLEAIQHTGVSGIFYAVQLATPRELTREEYERFGRPYDMEILKAANELFWFNLLHLHAADAYFDLAEYYPVQAVNWHDREGAPSLAEARSRFDGALVGGLRQRETMLLGTPADVRAEALDAIAQTQGRGFILATGCVTLVTSPLGNIRAARAVVEDAG